MFDKRINCLLPACPHLAENKNNRLCIGHGRGLLCKMPACIMGTIEKSTYCANHKCAIADCQNYKWSERGGYLCYHHALAHTCHAKAINCAYMAMDSEKYCQSHLCRNDSCHFERQDGSMYCLTCNNPTNTNTSDTLS